METIQAGRTAIGLFLPTSYETQERRHFPLLLSLGAFGAERNISKLHEEGVLPEMIVAEIFCDDALLDLVEITSELACKLRLLDLPAARWLAGAGHHGLLALETLLNHPDLFGAAACLSTSFEGIEGAPPLHSRALRALEDRAALPANVRLYSDYGTLGLDECYEPYHRDLGGILRAKGWSGGREFTIERSVGGTHTPDSWRDRLDPALRWLARPH